MSNAIQWVTPPLLAGLFVPLMFKVIQDCCKQMR
jgi:hypothetical protein